MSRSAFRGSRNDWSRFTEGDGDAELEFLPPFEEELGSEAPPLAAHSELAPVSSPLADPHRLQSQR